MTARDVIAEMREDAAKLRDGGQAVAGAALVAYADRLESTLAQPSGEAVALYCAACRTGFDEAGQPLYAPLVNRKGLARCSRCGGSYGQWADCEADWRLTRKPARGNDAASLIALAEEAGAAKVDADDGWVAHWSLTESDMARLASLLAAAQPTTPPAPLGGLTEAETEALEACEGIHYSQRFVPTLCACIRRLTAPRAEGVDDAMRRHQAWWPESLARGRFVLNDGRTGIFCEGGDHFYTPELDARTAAAPKVAAPQAEAGELASAISALVEIVEGAGCIRWQDSNGFRLKDTPEWCAFYVAAKVGLRHAQLAAQGGDGVVDAVVAEMSQMVREYATYPEAYQWMREVVAWRNKLAALAPQRSEDKA